MMEHFVVNNDGTNFIGFYGKKLAGIGRGKTELALYVSDIGEYICYSDITDERNGKGIYSKRYEKAKVVQTIPEVFSFFGQGKIAKKLYKRWGTLPIDECPCITPIFQELSELVFSDSDYTTTTNVEERTRRARNYIEERQITLLYRFPSEEDIEYYDDNDPQYITGFSIYIDKDQYDRNYDLETNIDWENTIYGDIVKRLHKIKDIADRTGKLNVTITYLGDIVERIDVERL